MLALIKQGDDLIVPNVNGEPSEELAALARDPPFGTSWRAAKMVVQGARERMFCHVLATSLFGDVAAALREHG